MANDSKRTSKILEDILYEMLLKKERMSYDEIVKRIRSLHDNFTHLVSAHMRIKDFLDWRSENQTIWLDDENKYYYPWGYLFRGDSPRCFFKIQIWLADEVGELKFELKKIKNFS